MAKIKKTLHSKIDLNLILDQHAYDTTRYQLGVSLVGIKLGEDQNKDFIATIMVLRTSLVSLVTGL